MTTYGAYDAGLPCKNPSCASHGKPHPNCRCYGDMAAGGDVGPFCSANRAHEKGCAYFQGGGDVGGTNEEPPGSVPTAAMGTDEEPPGSPSGGTNEEPPQPGQDSTLLASFEGGLKGFLGPLAELAIRTAPIIVGSELMTPEARAARQKAHPEAYELAQDATMLGSALTGTGLVGAATKASEAMVGAKFLQNAIEGGLLSASDEVSKWALGQGDPQDPVSSIYAIGASALFNSLLGLGGRQAASFASNKLKKFAEEKMGEKALSFLYGVAHASRGTGEETGEVLTNLADKEIGINPKAFKEGLKFAGDKIKKSELLTSGLMGVTYGAIFDDKPHKDREDKVYDFLKGAAIGWGARKTAKYAAPAVLKILSSGKVTGAAEAIDHMAQVAHGAGLVDRAVQGVFKTTPTLVERTVNAYGGDQLKKDLDTFFGKGGTTQSLQEELYDQNATAEEGYAEGGEVQKKEKPKRSPKPLLRPDDGVAIHYPAQNMLLSAARGRVSNYLMGLRPTPHVPKLPFDDEPDEREKKRGYDRALDIAIAPLSVMDEIRKGTVEPEHIKHLTAMYPELATVLQKKATEHIVKAQMDGKKPPYKVRQGLSLLLGTALSGEMTPQSIQAAQSVFQAKTPPPPKAQSSAPTGNTSKLSKVDQSFLTGSQARESRSQRRT